MEGLKLDLEVRKPEVVRGESIRFVLNLSNAGPNPVTIKDGTPENRAFSIHVTNLWGFDAWGNQMSVQAREGEHVDQPRKEPRKPLAPGEKWQAAGDIVAWIGDLEPGSYTVRGFYQNAPGDKVESADVEIKVGEAAPVLAQTAVRNLPLSLSPRVTAWLNKSGAGYDLFVLESSPKNPQVTYANIPLAQVAMPPAVFPSSYNTAPPMVQHMAWAEADGNLRVLRFRSDLPPEAPASIPLPDEDLEPMATPYSDERGNLHVLLATPEGDSAALLQVVGKAKPAFYPVKAVPPLAGPRCALWYRDGALAFAWADEEATGVFAATVPLNAPPRTIAGNAVFTSEHPVIDLALAQVYNEASENYDRVLFVLAHNQEDDLYYRWKINLADGKAEEDGRFEVTGAGNMRIIQSVFTEENVPLYLFARQDGAIIFADAAFTRLTPVLDENRKPVKASQHPGIVAPTSFSRIRGTFVRYIDQGKRFAYFRIV